MKPRSLKATNVSHVWKDLMRTAPALHHVSAEFVSGNVHFVCGPSGAGKSTLGLVLAGLIAPAEGRVELEGTDMRVARSRIAYLFQFPETIFFTESVEKELQAICPESHEADWQPVFERLGISYSEVRHRHPFSLSEGYARLVALATQLARRPDVLILDEPTIGLDWKHQERVIYGLRDWNTPEHLLIVITHDVDLLSELPGHTWVMIGGRLEWNGPTDNLLSNEELMRKSALLA